MSCPVTDDQLPQRCARTPVDRYEWETTHSSRRQDHNCRRIPRLSDACGGKPTNTGSCESEEWLDKVVRLSSIYSCVGTDPWTCTKRVIFVTRQGLALGYLHVCGVCILKHATTVTSMALRGCRGYEALFSYLVNAVVVLLTPSSRTK
jgi:hypothetical protein